MDQNPITIVPLSKGFKASNQPTDNRSDLIFDALALSIDTEFLEEYGKLMAHLESDSYSRVLVVSPDQLDAFPDQFNVVPTLDEARDFIEMERIERDLGF